MWRCMPRRAKRASVWTLWMRGRNWWCEMTAVASSLAMIAVGLVLLTVRGLGARPAVAAGGLLVASSAIGMTWAALGLSDSAFALREVIRVLTTIGFLIGFCLAAVALLNGACLAGPGPAALSRTPGEGGAA